MAAADENLTYGIIKGHRSNSNLLWIVEEKCLYVKKDIRSRGVEYICYQSILCDPKKKRSEDVIKCTARRIIDPHNKVTKNSIEHSCHDNHELIHKDLMTRNTIIDTVTLLKELCQDLNIGIPSQDIFTRELSK